MCVHVHVYNLIHDCRQIQLPYRLCNFLFMWLKAKCLHASHQAQAASQLVMPLCLPFQQVSHSEFSKQVMWEWRKEVYLAAPFSQSSLGRWGKLTYLFPEQRSTKQGQQCRAQLKVTDRNSLAGRQAPGHVTLSTLGQAVPIGRIQKAKGHGDREYKEDDKGPDDTEGSGRVWLACWEGTWTLWSMRTFQPDIGRENTIRHRCLARCARLCTWLPA